MQIQVFEENNRLYVEISEPPKGLKDALVKFTTDGVINVLEGLEPKTETKPEVKARKVSDAEPKVEVVPDKDDGFIDADDWAKATGEEIPFCTPEKTSVSESKPKSQYEKLLEDDDWA